MSEPVRIQWAITDLDVGGAERTLVEIVTRLDRRRWNPSVVCLQTPGNLAQRLAGAGIRVDSLELDSPIDLPRASRRWTKLLREQRPGLVVSFLYHANMLGRWVARKAGVPIHVSGVRVAEKDAPFRLWLDRITSAWTDAYVCVSKRTAAFTESKLAIPSSKVHVVPNGIDLEEIDALPPAARNEGNLRDADRVLVCVSRLHRQKGIDTLLLALEQLDPIPPNFKLLLIGDGPLRDRFKRWIEDSDLAGTVRLLGRTEDARRWIKASDGLVLPSRWEGMPNAVLEAMAARKPVIATDVEGIDELVIDRRTGWVVPVDSPTALASATWEWMEDADRRVAYGEAGRRRIQERFTAGQMVANWERVLCSIIDAHSIEAHDQR